MDRSLNSLSSDFRAKIDRVLAKLVERGIMIMIVQTGRTLAEHLENVSNGTTQTAHSKHIPRKLRGVGFPQGNGNSEKVDAIDLCPYEVYQLHGPDKLQWNGSDPAFRAIGEIGESEDLRWGGRWWRSKELQKTGFDPGHLELIITPVDRRLADEERKRPWPV